MSSLTSLVTDRHGGMDTRTWSIFSIRLGSSTLYSILSLVIEFL